MSIEVYEVARQAGVLGYCAFVYAPAEFEHGFYATQFPPTKTAEEMTDQIIEAGFEVHDEEQTDE